MTACEQLRCEPADLADPVQRERFRLTFNSIWPEWQADADEFDHELANRGPAQYWMVVAAGDGGGGFGRVDDVSAIGTVVAQRNVWNDDDAPPVVFALLPPRAMSPQAYFQVLLPAATFADEQGLGELRVLAWDRESVLREALETLPGWGEVSRAIDVGLDVQRFDQPARVVPDGYSIVTFAQRPDLERDLYACLRESMLDIPGDELEQPPPFERWQALHEAPGSRDDAVFLALNDVGEVAGFAELLFQRLLPDRAWHGYTGVRRSERGRGLAFALKHATINYARDHGIASLRTENEERNAPMRHINRALGYEPVARRMLLRGGLQPLIVAAGQAEPSQG